jgi:hypothetical protein
MKIAEAKEAFRKLVADYFGSDHVFFCKFKDDENAGTVCDDSVHWP